MWLRKLLNHLQYENIRHPTIPIRPTRPIRAGCSNRSGYIARFASPDSKRNENINTDRVRQNSSGCVSIWMDNMNKIIQGDCIAGMRTLPDKSVHTCVTSPPYFGLRDYGRDGQIGLEETPEQFVSALVEVFREVKRVLRDDGTLWLNLGDSYWGGGWRGASLNENSGGIQKAHKGTHCGATMKGIGTGKHELFKPKDLIGIPWRVAFALQADGWYLRQDIIWHKPNPMPESVTDRCTKAHEYIFLLSKSARYYYDADAIKEDAKGGYKFNGSPTYADGDRNDAGRKNSEISNDKNKRSVWTVTTKPYSGAHFATFPQDLIEPCIKAGCPPNGIVLDPFMGAGTTAVVARKLGRNYIGMELNQEYINIAEQRIVDELGMFA
jgi:DNA modification methylase